MVMEKMQFVKSLTSSFLILNLLLIPLIQAYSIPQGNPQAQPPGMPQGYPPQGLGEQGYGNGQAPMGGNYQFNPYQTGVGDFQKEGVSPDGLLASYFFSSPAWTSQHTGSPLEYMKEKGTTPDQVCSSPSSEQSFASQAASDLQAAGLVGSDAAVQSCLKQFGSMDGYDQREAFCSGKFNLPGSNGEQIQVDCNDLSTAVSSCTQGMFQNMQDELNVQKEQLSAAYDQMSFQCKQEESQQQNPYGQQNPNNQQQYPPQNPYQTPPSTPPQTRGNCNCPPENHPVCGLDGKTYGGDCAISCAGVKYDHEGPCGSPTSTTTAGSTTTTQSQGTTTTQESTTTTQQSTTSSTTTTSTTSSTTTTQGGNLSSNNIITGYDVENQFPQPPNGQGQQPYPQQNGPYPPGNYPGISQQYPPQGYNPSGYPQGMGNYPQGGQYPQQGMPQYPRQGGYPMQGGQPPQGMMGGNGGFGNGMPFGGCSNLGTRDDFVNQRIALMQEQVKARQDQVALSCKEGFTNACNQKNSYCGNAETQLKQFHDKAVSICGKVSDVTQVTSFITQSISKMCSVHYAQSNNFAPIDELSQAQNGLASSGQTALGAAVSAKTGDAASLYQQAEQLSQSKSNSNSNILTAVQILIAGNKQAQENAAQLRATAQSLQQTAESIRTLASTSTSDSEKQQLTDAADKLDAQAKSYLGTSDQISQNNQSLVDKIVSLLGLK